MKITLEGSLEEIKQQLEELSKALFTGIETTTEQLPLPETPKASTFTKRNKPGRKPKAETAAPIQAEIKTTTVVITESAPEQDEHVPTSKEDAISALQLLNGAKGLAVAKEVLASFGAARIGEVKEEDYSEFVKACKVKANE